MIVPFPHSPISDVRLDGSALWIARLGRDFLRDETGESMVGFALSASVLFTFIFGLTTMCLAFYTYQAISELAREGVRYAIVHGTTCETSSGSSCEVTSTQVNTYVQGIGIPNVGGGTMNVNTSYPDGGEVPNADRVEVTVTYTFPWHIPFSGTQNLSLTSSSEMYIIQ
jgi:Flp pilus assembly protein TadG